MPPHNLLDRIEINPSVMLGKPVIKGTRITVEQIVSKFSRSISIDEILREFPRLTEKDVRAALAYAAKSLSTEEFRPLRAKA